jgi:hypothetical protein
MQIPNSDEPEDCHKDTKAQRNKKKHKERSLLEYCLVSWCLGGKNILPLNAKNSFLI